MSVANTNSAEYVATSSCGGVVSNFILQGTTAISVLDCLNKCLALNGCTEFYMSKDNDG